MHDELKLGYRVFLLHNLKYHYATIISPVQNNYVQVRLKGGGKYWIEPSAIKDVIGPGRMLRLRMWLITTFNKVMSGARAA
jgi:hypothetical protein